MAKVKKFGICHLCGDDGPLTFEHVPPEDAYNDERVLKANIEKLLHEDLFEHLDHPTGRYQQRGAGEYTLCDSCNTKTGDWYARAYIAFVKQVFPLCVVANRFNTVFGNYTLKPLHVLKQIFVMFYSANPPCFAQAHPKLIRYLLNRESREPDESLRIYIALFDATNSKTTRQSGITGRLTLGGNTNVYSEIAFPPFVLVMTVNNGISLDSALTEITWFKNFAYNETTTIPLILRPLAVNTYFPADYRTLDEVRADVQQNTTG